MRISEICIQRPVFSTVLSLIIVLIGGILFSKLSIRGTPNIDIPVITISSVYPGSSAEYMEKNVTTRVEKAIRSVKNVDYTTSTSSTGSSSVIVKFKLGSDLNEALSDIRSKIADLSFDLPYDMRTPVASKQDPDNFPSLWLVVNSDKYTTLDLTDIVEKQILVQLERIASVGRTMFVGSKFYTVKIDLNPEKLYQYGINPADLEQIIKSQNKDYPAGSIKTDKLNFIISLDTQLKNPKQFENIIITTNDGTLLKLRDIATVSFDSLEDSAILKYNGKRTSAIGLVKQSNANILNLSDEVRKNLPQIQDSIPDGVYIKVAYDQSKPVRIAIEGVFHTILEALVLVFLTVYLFLGSARITIIPFITIPVSLIGTFTFMYLCGFSINTFSLLAMVLAIGLVVDDAIVVLENTYRYCEQGMSNKEAALKSINEIGFAVIAMTITLAAVFLPIGFLEGFLGKLFIEFAWTLAFSVIVSGFVALTLSPMMCSKMIKVLPTSELPTLLRKFSETISFFTEKYTKYLTLAINHKKIFWSISSTLVILAAISSMFVQKAFAPQEDDGILQMFFSAPEGTSLQGADKAFNEINKVIQSNPNVKNYIAVVRNDGGGFGFLELKDWSERSKSQMQIRGEINMQLMGIPEAKALTFNMPSILSGGSTVKPIEFNLQAVNNSDLKHLDEIAINFMNEMKTRNIFNNVEKDLKTSMPSINVDIDKDKAFLLGLNTESIGLTLKYLISGKKVTDFLMNDRIYNVHVGLPEKDRDGIYDLSKIYVKNNKGQMISLSSFAKFEETTKVKFYSHYNNVKAIQITSDLADGHAIGEAAEALNEIAKKVIKSKDIKMEFQGDLKKMNEQSGQMFVVFFIALLFIYLVLCAQFESFRDPLLILCSVPFSIVGAIFALFIAGNSMNLYSNIGIITLIGLVTKNAIMIIEFANHLKEQGHNVLESIVKASSLRFRPILMTSLACILGAIPLLFAKESGAAARESIGIVIVGGMLIGTIFTLFVIPVLYQTFVKDEN